MERLTFKLGESNPSYGLVDKASAKVGLFTDYDGFFAHHLATHRLGQYEDTGLTPEEIPQWVSVSERMPQYETVLAYVKHNYSDTDGWRAYRVYDYTDRFIGLGNLCEVTHWMPLPQPPAETLKGGDDK